MTLELLERGGSYWCLTAEMLMQVLPNVGEFVSYEKLAAEIRAIRPVSEARPAYLRALCTQLLGYAISGAHEQSAACSGLIEELVPVDVERDPVARGYARLWRAVSGHVLSDDIPRAFELVEKATRDLEESQVLYRLSLAQTVRSFCLWGLGRLDESEQAAWRAREIAERIRDGYHVSVADWYLGLVLAEFDDPKKLDQADRAALTMRELRMSPLFEPTSRIISARVALAKRDYARAESDGRSARQNLPELLPYSLLASAALIDALREQRRVDEAVRVAREDLEALARLKGPVCSEVVFRVPAAEALLRAGDSESARNVLETALACIERRAAFMTDPADKRCYLERRSENRRARELAERHFPELAKAGTPPALGPSHTW